MNVTETQYSIEAKVVIKKELMESILVTAFDGTYGGCWYWAQWGGMGLVKNGDDWEKVHIIFDYEDAPTKMMQTCYSQLGMAGGVPVGYEEISVGIARILNSDEIRDDLREMLLRAVIENDGGDVDADLADCIVQEALFGTQVYA